MKLLLQLSRLAQVLQHLLREATREAAADLSDDGALQPYVALGQQPVPQVVPVQVEGRRLVKPLPRSGSWATKRSALQNWAGSYL